MKIHTQVKSKDQKMKTAVTLQSGIKEHLLFYLHFPPVIGLSSFNTQEMLLYLLKFFKFNHYRLHTNQYFYKTLENSI